MSHPETDTPIIGSFAYKLRVGWSRHRGFDFSHHEQGLTTLEALRAEGFSGSMIGRFFRPFLGGVFLENLLDTTVRKLEFVMRNFARGDTAIPALGMSEIPRQLAAALPAVAIRLNTRVEAIDGNRVHLEERVRRQLVDWFGGGAKKWELLRIDRIPHAVPSQRVAPEKPARLHKGLCQCGDHRGIASLNTALASGAAAAQAVLDDLP
jgi:hypothetical protein